MSHYDDDRTPSYTTGNRRDTFVPAIREPVRVRRMEVLPPEQHELQVPGVVRTINALNTSHWDRAKGFSLVTVPLSAAVGVGALIISLYLFELPLWSLGALVVLFLGFMGTWLVAWIVYQLASPDGATIIGTIGHYKLLRYEQRARLRRMERDE
jgi:hypothetical protein